MSLPDDRLPRPAPIVDPLRCTDRAVVPQIEHVTDATWSPDSSAVALTRIVIVPSRKTITGYEEEERLTVLAPGTGAIRDLGEGKRAEWSGTGTHLSYWRDGHLYLNLDGTTAGTVEASAPDIRWKGDQLYFWYEDEIQSWHDGEIRTIARVEPEFMPRYPHDDVSFSADAERFLITRYALDGTIQRYVGVTATGAVVELEEADATFTEWSPRGQTLFIRTSDHLVLREPSGARRASPLSAFAGGVHGWTADGRVLVGAVSPTVPGGNVFDRIPVWDPDDEGDTAVATLPNLFGARSFSPDGRWFTGVSRTGLYATQLELYRCGTVGRQAMDPRADPVARARLAQIDGDARRFVRPVAGAVTQFIQGRHTGIDIAAREGSIIVAADEGTVDAAGWVPVGGRRICVQHAGGLESCYYHTSSTLVSVGERVARGQPIALVGMTGVTTGPHVHWEVRHDGRVVDPLGL